MAGALPVPRPGISSLGQPSPRKRFSGAAVLGCGVALLCLASMVGPTPVFMVWNVTPSAPVGLYLVSPGTSPGRGDMVVARMPRSARPLAALRHYLPADVPMVKRVAATAGDLVCGSGARIRINGATRARRLEQDSAGRAMPWWNGCVRLGSEEYLLMTGNPRSFDGRYFGISSAGEILGRARLLWAR